MIQARQGLATKPIALAERDDPGRKAAKLTSSWIVDHVVTAGINNANGTAVQVHPRAIRRGDFVDVLVTVEVVSTRGRTGKGRRVEVFFCPHQVLRVSSAADLVVSLQSRWVAPVNVSVQAQRKDIVQRTGDASTNVQQVAQQLEGFEFATAVVDKDEAML